MADVNNPPAGGFQQGGWYWDPAAGQARQYWDGGFGAPTTVADPSAAGFGERVSEETQKQSGFVAPNPTSKDQVPPYLNQFQDSMFQSANRPDIKIPTMEELKSTLLPS